MVLQIENIYKVALPYFEIEKEHNQQLQYRKKEYITFVNGFQNMLRNIPAGQFLAPMLGEKTQGLAQSAQQMMLYKKHQKEIEASGVGAFPFQAKAEKANAVFYQGIARIMKAIFKDKMLHCRSHVLDRNVSLS